MSGSWSVCYFIGHVFSNEISKGFDGLSIDVPSVEDAASHRYSNLPRALAGLHG